MANNTKLLSQDEIHELLKPLAEEIVNDVRTVAGIAINTFYADYTPFLYKRAFGFSNLAKFYFDDVATETKDGYLLKFRFSADDVTVNPFERFGDGQGSPEWAFDTGFVHGYHGGPNIQPYHSMGGIWTMIEDYVKSL